MPTKTQNSSYEQRKNKVLTQSKKINGSFRIRKSSASNLFRYTNRARKKDVQEIYLGQFNHILNLDKETQTLEVEGLATYDDIVTYTLGNGFLPTVSPELKHITVGGATVGIGIESSCFRHGFVHDGLKEADVLLPNGEVVSCRADNQYADIFFGLPNSYGTLGYILRAKIALMPAKPFVRVENIRYRSIDDYISAMEETTKDDSIDFIEGLFYKDDEFYLTISRLVEEAPSTEDIYRDHIFYKLLRDDTVFFLDTYDYIFRYDPDWFWNVPEGGFYDLFRRFSPRRFRNSGFYQKYTAFKRHLISKKEISEEQLIQDWEIPWESAGDFVRYALREVDLKGQPWVALPIKTPKAPTNYPIKANTLYFNVGCYCFTDRPRKDIDFYYTRILDRKCFDLGGIKMLYSSTFLQQDEFDQIYNGLEYAKLKAKYDPDGRAPTLFDKSVLNH